MYLYVAFFVSLTALKSVRVFIYQLQGDENIEAKSRAFTGSQEHFRARTGSVVRLFIHLSVFRGIFFVVAAVQACFDRSNTVYVDAIFDLLYVPSPHKSRFEKP